MLGLIGLGNEESKEEFAMGLADTNGKLTTCVYSRRVH